MTEVTSQPGVLELFGLNGKLFLAQLINFAVVIFVVAKWVYKPLLKAIDAREGAIQKGLHDAEEAKRERQAAVADARHAHDQAQLEARALIEAARGEAAAERAKLMAETQVELERQLSEARARLKEEKLVMTAAFKKEMVELVLAATTKVVAKTLDEKGHRALIEQAIKELEQNV